VAISAGISPVAIGTETDGSLCVPVDRAALYSLKTTVGSGSMEGILLFTPFTDSLGPTAKKTKDITTLLTVMMDDKDFSSALIPKWDGIRVGFANPETFSL
jgi:amidase